MAEIYKNPRLEYKGKVEDFPLENYPDYEPGRPPRIEKLWDIDYLDEVERVTGKRWGGFQGIGRLREAALTMPTEQEASPLWTKDPPFFWFRRISGVDLGKLQKGIADLGKLLEDNGVKVHWVEIKESMGAYGPMRKMFMTAQACVLRGGAIIARAGYCSYTPARAANLNILKFLASINCPILLTVHGKGMISPGACVPLAEDAIMLFRSQDANDEGINQVVEVMRRCGVKETPICNLTTIYDTFESGGEFHLDMVMGILGKRLALLYPGYFDAQAFIWLQQHGFKIIEIPRDEHHKFYPANLVILEPGKVIMAAGAKETIKRVRAAGVEVIEFDTSYTSLGGNGIACLVGRLVRDRGPGLYD